VVPVASWSQEPILIFLHRIIPPKPYSNFFRPLYDNLHGCSADIPVLSSDCLDTEIEGPNLHQGTNNEEATESINIEVATQRKAIPKKPADRMNPSPSPEP